MIQLDTILVLIILSNLLLLGSSRMRVCIKTTALQGIIAGLLPLSLKVSEITLHLIALGLLTAGIKGVLFPYLLSRNLRNANANREVEPFVGYTASIIAGVIALVAAFKVDSIANLSLGSPSPLLVPVSIFTMFTGLFLITARRKAITQVLGFIVLENGIYAFGLSIVRNMPVIVEIGVLMDVFVAVFVMGIAVYHISREFDHIDADQLNLLKE